MGWLAGVDAVVRSGEIPQQDASIFATPSAGGGAPWKAKPARARKSFHRHGQPAERLGHSTRRTPMTLVCPPQDALETPAIDFRLPGTDGKDHTLSDIAGEQGTVIVFICNHCPYVVAVIDRLVADARVLQAGGFGFAAICSNDAAQYPDDSLDNMKRFAKAHGFSFPYLHDETQAMARAYGAVCTPDFFGYGTDLKLKYRGRLDVGRTAPPPPGAKRELVEAMRFVAATGKAPAEQIPSAGCSIKWKA